MRSRASRSLPSHSIEPASGKKTPVIIRMVVVFPAPLRPSSPVIVPRWTVNETPSTARTAPNVFTTSRTDKTTDMRKLPGESPAYCKREGGLGFGEGGVFRSNRVEDLFDLPDDSFEDT